MIIMLLISGCITMYCSTLLLEVRKHVSSSSYTDIGEQLFGFWGKWSVNIAVAGSQTLFCCGYVYFICDNVHFILQQVVGETHEITYTGIACGLMFCVLCWIRKIELFAATSMAGNIIILLVLLFVMFEGGNELVRGDRGGKGIGGGVPAVS